MFEVDAIFVGLVTFAIVFIIFVLLRRNGQDEGDKRIPPSIPSLPIVGSSPFIRVGMGEMPKFFTDKAATLGPVIHFYTGTRLGVVLNGREAIIDAMEKHPEAFADRGQFWIESKLVNVEHKGIIFSHYHNTFKRTHKITLAILKEFGFGDASESEVRILEEVEPMIKEIYGKNGQPFYPKYAFATANASIMMKIVFGRKAMSLIDPLKLLLASNKYVTGWDPKYDSAPIIRFIPKYGKQLEHMVNLHSDLMELVKEAIRYAKADDSETNFVRRYLEMEGPDYEREQFLYVIRDLMLGSADTVSSTIQWALIELSSHLEAQARLQKEIDEVIPASRLPSLDDKPNLPYTEAVIMETMRYHTLVPFSVPHMTLRDTKVCGYDIPRGCLVYPNIHCAHMDPKVWIDPENFRPERFLDKENNVIGRELVIPFGNGKRACIGEILARQSLFLLFTSIVQHFAFRPPEGQTSIKYTLDSTITVRPMPFDARLIPRKKA